MGETKKPHDFEMESAVTENIVQKESEKMRSRISVEPMADSEPENIGEEKLPVKRKIPLLFRIFNVIYMSLITACIFFAINFFFEYKNEGRFEDDSQLISIYLLKSIGCTVLGILLAFSKTYMNELYFSS